LAEEKKDVSATRLITKGVIGGFTWGFVLYTLALLVKVAVNTITAPVLPDTFELVGLAIGFGGGVVKNL